MGKKIGDYYKLFTQFTVKGRQELRKEDVPDHRPSVHIPVLLCYASFFLSKTRNFDEIYDDMFQGTSFCAQISSPVNKYVASMFYA